MPMSMPEFIERFEESINETIVQLFPPVYNAETRKACGFDLRRLSRRPLGAQGDAIRAAALSLQANPCTNIVGEMGTGKSFCGAAAAYLAGCRSVLLLCPPHLTRKWAREIRATVPGAQPAIVGSIAELRRVLASVPAPAATRRGGVAGEPTPLRPPPRFVILSRERAKLGYRWRGAYTMRAERERGAGGRVVRLLEPIPCCPRCLAPVLDKEEIPVDPRVLDEKKHRCAACRESLWQAEGAPRRTLPLGRHLREVVVVRAGRRGEAPPGHRFPLAEYIAERTPGAFDLLLVDEVHEFKARGSAQGIAMGQLAEAIGRVLTCTGTLTGGYASTLFSVLWRVDREFRKEFAYNEEERFINLYGVVERQYREEGGEDAAEYGRMSKRRLVLTRVRERPGLAPAILFKLIHNTVFLRLRDVSRDLPPYREHVLRVPLDARPSPTGIAGADGEELTLPSQRDAYRRLADTLREKVTAALRAKGKSKLLGAYLQALLAYPDGCCAGEVVLDKDTGAIIAEAPAQPEDRTYPKEQALIELALRERERGRRVLAFVTHTDTRDVTPRLRRVLEGAGLRVAVLKAHTTRPDLREEWVARQVAAGIDVLIAPPKCVQTGLDLIAFPTIVWAQPEYSVYTLRQASRRSWRIAQARPVDVYYLVYAETMQAEALSLVGKKLRAAMMVEGELPQEGLATDELGDSDLLLALAKRLAAGESAEVESLESLFAESLALEEGAGRAIDGFEWEEAEWGAPPATFPVAHAAAPQMAGTAAALQPALFDAPPVEMTTAVPGRAIHTVQGDRADAPSGPIRATDDGASGAPDSPAPFVPSVGQIVTLDNLAALATSRRARGRKAPAKDQLSLFEGRGGLDA